MKTVVEQAFRAPRWAPAAGLVLLLALFSYSLRRAADHSGGSQAIMLAESPTTLVVDSHTGRAFVGTSGPYGGGHVLVVDTGTGMLLRAVSLTSAPVAMAMDERAGHVVVASGGAAVVLLDATTGNVLRTTIVHHSPFALAVDEQTRRAFVLSEGVGDPQHSSMSVNVLDTRSGVLLHTLAVGRLPGQLALDRPAGRVLLTSPDAGTTSTLYVLDARSGTLLHTRRLKGYITGMAVDERSGCAYLISADTPRLRVLDARSGAVLRALPLDARPMAVAVDRTTGHVFIQNATGTRVLDARTGRLRRLRGPGQAAPTRLLVADGPRVVVASWGNGTLSLMDRLRGGRCVVPVAGDLVALATDQRTARMVVLTGADMVPAGDVAWAAWARGLLAWPPRLRPPTRSRRFVAGAVNILDTSCL
ncbi:MAG TPA: YncE family protein [Chloroflexota bacterium]|nr:YncE family protein [Chloroflexota bacterium]